jgi:hypothetical protein
LDLTDNYQPPDLVLRTAVSHLPTGWDGEFRNTRDTSYWDIVGRDNPRKGVPTVRRQPRRRKTVTGMQQDGSSLPQNSRASTASGAPLLKNLNVK